MVLEVQIRRKGSPQGEVEQDLPRHSYMGDNHARLFRLFREVPVAREDPGARNEQMDKTKSEMNSIFDLD